MTSEAEKTTLSARASKFAAKAWPAVQRFVPILTWGRATIAPGSSRT